MASSGTVDPKAALAEIVSPQTLLDIEEYIKPQFPRRQCVQEVGQQSLTTGLSQQGGTFSRRRIVMDGHGRWREVKPRTYSNMYQNNSSYKTSSSELNGAFQWSERLGNVEQGDSTEDVLSRKKYVSTGTLKRHPVDAFKPAVQRNSTNTATSTGSSKTYMYDHLSMTMRSNIFPGLGNNRWDSTTSRTFVEKATVPPRKRSKFFGIQTDEFGQWSAANVHHEKMKKAWDDYLSNTKKPSANWKPPVSQSHPEPEAPKPTPKPKKPIHKPKPKKNPSAVQDMTPPQVSEEVSATPVKPPIDLPPDDNDDSFWDFYDKPFNKPS